MYGWRPHQQRTHVAGNLQKRSFGPGQQQTHPISLLFYLRSHLQRQRPSVQYVALFSRRHQRHGTNSRYRRTSRKRGFSLARYDTPPPPPKNKTTPHDAPAKLTACFPLTSGDTISHTAAYPLPAAAKILPLPAMKPRHLSGLLDDEGRRSRVLGGSSVDSRVTVSSDQRVITPEAARGGEGLSEASASASCLLRCWVNRWREKMFAAHYCLSFDNRFKTVSKPFRFAVIPEAGALHGTNLVTHPHWPQATSDFKVVV